MDSEPEEEETEMKDLYPEGNVKLPGVDIKGKEVPQQVIEIDDSKIPQDTSLTATETAL